MRLLLIEDEEVLGRATAQSLVRAGFRVDRVLSGSEALAAARTHDYDIVLLDLGLPDLSGEEVLRQLRAQRNTVPVVVMTARGQIDDRIQLLDLGADDYLVKPVDVNELQARMRALKRRVSAATDANDQQVVGALTLSQASRTVTWEGRPVTLTAKEYDVLEALVMRRPRVVSRAQIEEALYGWGDEVESNSIEVYVHFLRRKLSPKVIVTVRGRGYQLGDEASLAGGRGDGGAA